MVEEKKNNLPQKEGGNEVIQIYSNPDNCSTEYFAITTAPSVLVRQMTEKLEQLLYTSGNDTCKELVKAFEVSINRINKRLKDRAKEVTR